MYKQVSLVGINETIQCNPNRYKSSGAYTKLLAGSELITITGKNIFLYCRGLMVNADELVRVMLVKEEL